jgi:hypothetical protein
MTRFVVDLGTLAISPEKERAIAAAVQTAVLSHLADVPNVRTQQALIPLRWLGIVWRPTIQEFAQAEQDIRQFANAP